MINIKKAYYYLSVLFTFCVFDKLIIYILNDTYYSKGDYAYKLKLGYYYCGISRIILIIIFGMFLIYKTGFLKKAFYTFITLFMITELFYSGYVIYTKSNDLITKVGITAEYNDTKYFVTQTTVNSETKLNLHYIKFYRLKTKDIKFGCNTGLLVDDITFTEYQENYYGKCVFIRRNRFSSTSYGYLYKLYLETYEYSTCYEVRIYDNEEYHRVCLEAFAKFKSTNSSSLNFEYIGPFEN